MAVLIISVAENIEFESDNINVIQEPEVKNFDGLDIALVPWINSENYEDVEEFLGICTADIVMCHGEINGANETIDIRSIETSFSF